MPSMLANLGAHRPVLAAPMAGGPTTPELVVAVASSGSLAQLAAGYLSPDQLQAQIAEVRRHTATFGVNLFAPPPIPVDRTAFQAYAGALREVASRYGIDLRGAPVIEDDDGWEDKVAVLLEDPVPLVSFTFGLPGRAVVDRFARAGTATWQTVTSPEEAAAAAEAGVDGCIVQAGSAGGHSGTLDPTTPPLDLDLPELVARVRARVDLPVIAAGGVAGPGDVAAALHAGALAVAVGTALVAAPESGASELHKAALGDPSRGPTVRTRAFTGRPARALPNDWTRRFGELAPLGYPALHHLTRPVRQAAAAAGDDRWVSLWAGTGHAAATRRPVAVILEHLAGG